MNAGASGRPCREAGTVSLVGVTRRFADTRAVDDVTIGTTAGEMLVLLGPSGCGKSTTLRLIAGFERPDSGSVELNGRVVADDRSFVPPNRRGCGVVFQSYALWPHRTVAANVAFGLRVWSRRVPRAEARARVAEVLQRVALADFADRYPHQLSGGQQQRVALARALVVRPEILLLDEPLSNLDAALRDRMRFEIRTLHRELGVTTVYVTHDQAEALALADRIAVMRAGRIEQAGSPADLWTSPVNPYVARALGPVETIDGVVVRVDSVDVVVELAGTKVRATGQAKGLAIGDRVEVGMRPQSVTAVDGTDAVVEEVLFAGDHHQCEVRLAGQRMRVRSRRSGLRPGDAVGVRVDPGAALIFPWTTGWAPPEESSLDGEAASTELPVKQEA